MTWTVTSKRLAWPAGTVLGAGDLAGCNIEALVQGGHLAPVKQEPAPKVDGPRRKMKVEPVEPETDDDSAEEPEEQE